ncbi:MAG: T9SS type A sorting domain-containing protein [Sphingobacteriales bacterium]|nr:MAG: T9SS type A sorting domain-containing protein [Sphingobacteriales bacterium]
MHTSIYRIAGTAILCAALPICTYARMSANTDAQRDKKPLSFVENKGQIIDQNGNKRTDIDFKLSIPGMNIFLGDGQIHYQWHKQMENKLAKKFDPVDLNVTAAEFAKRKQEHSKQKQEVLIYRLDAKLLGANINAPLSAEEEQAYYETYHTAYLEGKVSSYNKVIYRNVYPNIDWVLYTDNNQLKYDFIVHPGGDPKNIKLQYGGTTDLLLKDGALTAVTPYGAVQEQKPYTYNATTKQQIASKYVLKDKVLSFDVAANTGEGDIVIDPTINWSTYFGDGGGENGGSVEADNGGNAYLGGATNSNSNIATIGSYQSIWQGGTDGYMAKFNPNGTRAWSTYYGGLGNDNFYSIAYDPVSGNIYAAGSTESTTSVATTGAHQATYGGGSTFGYWYGGDAMLIKFTNAGGIVWGTYYGGSADENNASVACDGLGNVYLAGVTESTTSISAGTGIYQSALNAMQDGFLVKFNGSGARQWGTYFGGNNTEWGAAVSCNLTGTQIYLVGQTYSSTGIASSATVYQPAIVGYYDGYLAQFTASGSLNWATYYGGNSSDGLNDAGCDAANNVYVCGFTYSTTGIASTGAYSTTLGGYGDGCIAKFNSSGALQWSTYFGGNNYYDFASGLEVRPDGSFFACGMTQSTNLPVSSDAYKSTFGGVYDIYLSEWSNLGTPTYVTYFGGPDYEYPGSGNGYGWGWGGSGGGSLSYTPAGYVYIAGNTNSSTDISTSGSFQPVFAGGSAFGYYGGDAFLASFIVDTMVAIHQPYIDTVLCPGDSIKLPYEVTYHFRSGNVFTAELSDATGAFTTPITIGTKTSGSNDTIKCYIPTTVAGGTGYRIRIKATAPIRTSGDNEKNIRIKPKPSGVTATSNAPICKGGTLNLAGTASVTGGGTITYLWEGPNLYTSTTQNPVISPAVIGYDGTYTFKATADGCMTSSATIVSFLPDPAVPLAGNNGPVCQNAQINLTANSSTPGVTYYWSGPAGFVNAAQNPVIANATSNKGGVYSVTATAPNGCTSEPGLTTLVVKPAVTVPAAGGNTPICTGSTLQLTASTVTGATYEWTGPLSFTSTLQNPTIPGIVPAQSGLYEVKAFFNGCWSEPGQINVVTTTVSFIGGYASPNDTICAGTQPTFVALPANGGPTPVYQWYKNFSPIAGATALRYIDAAVADGDAYYCTMYSVGVCPDPVYASTDTIEMHVMQTITQPEVSITSIPEQPLPGISITFKAAIVNGGYQPTYQWFRNDKLIYGATYSNWTANYLDPYDKITVVAYTSDPCAATPTDTSNAIVVNFTTGVNNLNENTTLGLYPNPNNGDFKLTGSLNGTGIVTLSIVNVAGQVLYSEQIKANKGIIDHSVTAKDRLVPAVYILRLEQDGMVKNIRFTVGK